MFRLRGLALLFREQRGHHAVQLFSHRGIDRGAARFIEIGQVPDHRVHQRQLFVEVAVIGKGIAKTRGQVQDRGFERIVGLRIRLEIMLVSRDSRLACCISTGTDWYRMR